MNENDLIAYYTPEAIAAREQKLVANSVAHAANNAHRAIGLPFRVRIDKRTTVAGVIVACEGTPSGKWRITMECGSAKVLRTFTVSSIPVLR